MSWQDEWRRRAHGWIQRLNRLALEWHQLDRNGVRLARERRRVVLSVRDAMYEVIDIYLGGIDKLSNRLPGHKTKGLGDLGAVPALAIAGASVTVVSIAAWISNEEERVIRAKAQLVRAVGEEARKATDPVVARKLAGVAERLNPNVDKGPSWWWLLPVLAVPAVPAVVKYVRGRLEPVAA